MTYPQHIQEKANEMLAKGAKMTFEAICEMYMKSEAKAAKKAGSKKEAAKWAQREAAANDKTANTLWGPGCKYSTQAEYQRSCMGDKWSKTYYNK